MAKRHTLHNRDLKSIFGRLQELVLANSGEDEFEEIFKLIIAKLFSEIQPGAKYNFYVQETPGKTAQIINSLLASANEKWEGVLNGDSISHLTDEHLTICVEALQDLMLLDMNLEVLDAAFEYLISREAKGSKGQYFTPRYVIDCCVNIVNPSPNEMVLDPACGSAGFLIHTMHHIRQYYPSVDLAKYCEDNLWGYDFDYRAIRVAKTLMLISGDGKGNLFRLNSLLKSSTRRSLFDLNLPDDSSSKSTLEDVMKSRLPDFNGFDIILTNPPFAGEVKEPDILQSYDLSKGKQRIERDVLFLERCVRLLKPGGRFAIVLPDNKLNSATWANAREWLVRHIRIVAVLSLGRNTFLPHTHQKAGILFGVKREQPISKPANEDILFLISEKDGKDTKGQIISRANVKPDKGLWRMVDHDLGDLVINFNEFLKTSQVPWRRS